MVQPFLLVSRRSFNSITNLVNSTGSFSPAICLHSLSVVIFLVSHSAEVLTLTLSRQRHPFVEGGGASRFGRKNLLRWSEVISLPKTFLNRRTISSCDVVVTSS